MGQVDRRFEDIIQDKLELNATEAELQEEKFLAAHPLTKQVTTLRDDLYNLDAALELKSDGKPEDITAALDVLKEMAGIIEGMKDTLMALEFTKEA